jgi:hypothetical protein
MIGDRVHQAWRVASCLFETTMQRGVLDAMHCHDSPISVRLLPMLFHFSELRRMFFFRQLHEMFVVLRRIGRFPVTRQRRLNDRRCGQLRRSTDVQNKGYWANK